MEHCNGISDADLYRTDNPEEKDLNGNPHDSQKMMEC
jgi:hypothetical protein